MSKERRPVTEEGKRAMIFRVGLQPIDASIDTSRVVQFESVDGILNALT